MSVQTVSISPSPENQVEITNTNLGLRFSRYFTKEETGAFGDIKWEKRDAVIKSAKGETVFEKLGVEVPDFWSQNAANIAASHYLYGNYENSVRQWIDRVAGTIAEWGLKDGYFATEQDGKVFYDELAWLMVNQYLAFNSPVNYNCGVYRYDKGGDGSGRYYWDKEAKVVREAEVEYKHPQCSACFILGVHDSMQGIMETARAEAMIFKGGSGAGYNISALRSSMESIRGKGKSSGPVTFMKGFDAFAGVIKSGGKTRRAAKMVILDVEHPDVEEFIWCKVKEERKAHILIQNGYDSSLDGEVYTNIFYQNANNSVRVTDVFMKAAEEGRNYWTKFVKNGENAEEKDAKGVLKQMAQAAWECGDPGVQYHDIINHWHTCADTEPIRGSNPCSEYMFLDNTACNLASLNLMRFRKDGGEFDVEAFRSAVTTLITAQEIIVGNSSYPTPAIAERSHIYRTLGIGYANLGSLLMSLGIPYDSDKGRALSAAITAVMTGQSYRQSAMMAHAVGPFPGYSENKNSFQKVMRQHRDAVANIDSSLVPYNLLQAAREVWNDTVSYTDMYGARNAQTSVLAPTGTISFVMDCRTTGVEPNIAIVAYKKMVGGGYMKLVNDDVPMALRTLGYSESQISEIIKYIEERDTIEGAPGLKEEHLPVFDCSFKANNGTRYIHHMGHIKMMAATQPFISGAISKTVNMPSDTTVEDVMDTYMQGWKHGLKALAIYRDGSKMSQPLNTKNESKDKNVEEVAVATPEPVSTPTPVPQPLHVNGKANGNGLHLNGAVDNWEPRRKKLPEERLSVTHKFEVAGHEGYITVGLYPDGKPGEVFITMSKQGSTIAGLMDSFATLVSFNLQYGVPLEFLVDKFAHTRFEPAGFTKNKQIPMAKSIIDYLFRWMALKFLNQEQNAQIQNSELISGGTDLLNQNQPKITAQEVESITAPPAVSQAPLFTFQNQSDAPACDFCGSITVRNGSCYKCMECGRSTGCS